MNKNILKIALIGLVAGFCISAKDVSANRSKETAMSRCSKSNGNGNGKGKKCRKSCSDGRNCKSGGSSYETTDRYEDLRNNYSTEEYTPKANEVAAKRKSAAQKVLEGY